MIFPVGTRKKLTLTPARFRAQIDGCDADPRCPVEGNQMPVADVHGDICAQNDTSPTLCEAPAAWGVGYFYFIFWCSCLLVFNPHPVQIPNLRANLVQVQLAS